MGLHEDEVACEIRWGHRDVDTSQRLTTIRPTSFKGRGVGEKKEGQTEVGDRILLGETRP